MNLIDTLWQNARSIPETWPRGIIALDSPEGLRAPAPHNEGRGNNVKSLLHSVGDRP